MIKERGELKTISELARQNGKYFIQRVERCRSCYVPSIWLRLPGGMLATIIVADKAPLVEYFHFAIDNLWWFGHNNPCQLLADSLKVSCQRTSLYFSCSGRRFLPQCQALIFHSSFLTFWTPGQVCSGS